MATIGVDVAPAITAGFTFGEALLALITKTLPSDEQKLASFKARYPEMYMKVRMHILNQSFRYMRHHRAISPEDFITFVGGQFAPDEKQAIINMLNAEVNKPVSK